MFARAAASAFRAARSVAPRLAVPAVATAVALSTAVATVAVCKPVAAAAGEALPFTGVPGTPHERSFVAIKPDGVQRGLTGDIIARFEKKGYKLVAVKMVKPSRAQAEEHYGDLSKKPFFPSLVEFFSSGPIVAMVWEGQGCIKGIRQMMGTTNPADSLPGSIRGDYCIITGRNIIHGSDGPESAKNEISHWFKPEELTDYTSCANTWIYESH